jgi:hypothetical protein
MPAASPTYLTGLVSGHALELDPHSVAAAPIALLPLAPPPEIKMPVCLRLPFSRNGANDSPALSNACTRPKSAQRLPRDHDQFRRAPA